METLAIFVASVLTGLFVLALGVQGIWKGRFLMRGGYITGLGARLYATLYLGAGLFVLFFSYGFGLELLQSSQSSATQEEFQRAVDSADEKALASVLAAHPTFAADRTIYLTALRKDQGGILKVLLKYGLDLNAKGPDGAPLWQEAFQLFPTATGETRTVANATMEIVLAQVKDINSPLPQSGRTVLFQVCLLPSFRHFLPMLLAHGANPDQADSKGQTVWTLCQDPSVLAALRSARRKVPGQF